MTPRCPRCDSTTLVVQQRAQHACSALGVTAGAAAGFSSAIGGAETGAAIGALAGPLGTFAGAVLGALAAGAAGCLAGFKVGRIVDHTVLGDLECTTCGHCFFDKDVAV